MSHRDALRQLSASLNSNKLNRLIEQKFNGDVETIEREMSAVAERIKARGAEFNAMMEGGVPTQLAAFRKAVGEDMWTTIAPNPQLLDLVRAWLGEEQRKMAMLVVEESKKLLPDDHDMTDQEILQAIGAQLG